MSVHDAMRYSREAVNNAKNNPRQAVERAKAGDAQALLGIANACTEENWKQKFVLLGVSQIAVGHLENPNADHSAKQFSLTMMVNLTAHPCPPMDKKKVFHICLKIIKDPNEIKYPPDVPPQTEFALVSALNVIAHLCDDDELTRMVINNNEWFKLLTKFLWTKPNMSTENYERALRIGIMMMFHVSFIEEGSALLVKEITKEQWQTFYGYIKIFKKDARALEEILHVFNNSLRNDENITKYLIEWGFLTFLESYLKENMLVDPFIFGIIGNINIDSSRSVMLIEKHPDIVRAMFMNAAMSPHPDTSDGTLFCIRKLTMECELITRHLVPQVSKPLLGIGGDKMAAGMMASRFKEVRDYGEVIATRLAVASGKLPKTASPCGNPSCSKVGTDFKLCSRCRHTRYCSRDCQAAHWKSGEHKKVCDLYANVEKEMHGKDVKNFRTTAHYYVMNHFPEIDALLKKAKLGYQQVVVKLDMEGQSPVFDYWPIDDFYDTMLKYEPYSNIKGTLLRLREQLTPQTFLMMVFGDSQMGAYQFIIPPEFLK